MIDHKGRSFWAAFTVLLLLVAGAGSVSAESPTVSVKSQGGRITVRVDEPTELSAVLGAVCQHIQARCEGLEATVGMPIQPTTITDTWPGVVRKLLEGSGLNHIALGPAGNKPARLLLSVRPEGPAESAAAPERADMGRGKREDVSSTLAGMDEAVRERLEREWAASESADKERTPTPPSTPLVPFVPPPGMAASPFPGPDGTPIVMPKDNTPPGQAPNPFLDPFGNPIPPEPGGPPVIGSPFLGPDGKPILTAPLPPGQTPNPFVTGTPPK
ncbi:MAG: hypothetical protein L0338_28180 [Acidobacteria bacterium]|nr:hypothetical protein [Acidobacteriota bacterium]